MINRFVVHLEELINEWKLNSNSSDNKNLLNNSENDVIMCFENHYFSVFCIFYYKILGQF